MKARLRGSRAGLVDGTLPIHEIAVRIAVSGAARPDGVARSKRLVVVCMERARSLAVFLAILAGAALWIEQGNRVAIGPAQVAGYQPCADSDAIPYSAPCIEFMMGTAPSERRAD